MNVFFLSLIPSLAAKWHCDKHVVKMVLEAVQILYTAHHLRRAPDLEWLQSAPLNTQNQHGYKKTHSKHPSVLWVAESRANYQWLTDLCVELNKEYKRRYGGKTHSVEPHIVWLRTNVPPYGTTEQEFTPPKIAMTPNCKEHAKENDLSAVDAYHYYYITEKLGFVSYRNLVLPPFLQGHFTEEDNFNKLGVTDPRSRNLLKSALLGESLLKETKEAYGLTSPHKEALLVAAVQKQIETPRKWNECVGNGVRITNAVKRVLGKNTDVKFQTPFDKQAGKRKRKVADENDEDFEESPKKVKVNNPPKTEIIVN